MLLHYLDFDFSDEDSGRGSFDALASVAPDRLPAVLAEINTVLRWAYDAWGPAGSLDDEGDWDCLLQASDEADRPLEARCDAATRQAHVAIAPEVTPAMRLVTVSFTLSGTAGFCEDFRRRFAVGD